MKTVPQLQQPEGNRISMNDAGDRLINFNVLVQPKKGEGEVKSNSLTCDDAFIF